MNTPEESFELLKGWAEGKAKRRHSKTCAIMPAYKCPSLEEFESAALQGLWSGCLKYTPDKGYNLKSYCMGRILNEFQRLRREYDRYETGNNDFQHGSAIDVDGIVAKEKPARDQ